MSESDRDRILAELSLRSFGSTNSGDKQSATTKRGDNGQTSLLFGREVPKWHPRIRLVGLLDSATSFLNLCRIKASERDRHTLNRIQETLVYVMGEIAVHNDDYERFLEFYHSLTEKDLNLLEESQAFLEDRSKGFGAWVENLDSTHAYADTARTFVRQAEALAWQMAEESSIRSLLPQWLNRLSDYLWTLSRSEPTK